MHIESFPDKGGLMTENWLSQALIAATLLIPVWLAIGFFDRNYQVKPDVFLVWYFPGVAALVMLFGQSPIKALVPSLGIVCAILLIGIPGGIANVLLFRAVIHAPNPGLPLSILSITNVGVFLVPALLSRWLPDYFDTVKIDMWALLGVILVAVGASIIAVRQ